MTLPIISCPYCKNLNDELNPEGRRTCKAFPEGIPDAIVFGENHHIEPFPGDNGIRFDPVAGADAIAELINSFDV